MTTDSTKLDLIMKAVEETQGSVQVLFNYRYNPVHEKIFDVISSGAIGDVTSVRRLAPPFLSEPDPLTTPLSRSTSNGFSTPYTVPTTSGDGTATRRTRVA